MAKLSPVNIYLLICLMFYFDCYVAKESGEANEKSSSKEAYSKKSISWFRGRGGFHGFPRWLPPPWARPSYFGGVGRFPWGFGGRGGGDGVGIGFNRGGGVQVQPGYGGVAGYPGGGGTGYDNNGGGGGLGYNNGGGGGGVGYNNGGGMGYPGDREGSGYSGEGSGGYGGGGVGIGIGVGGGGDSDVGIGIGVGGGRPPPCECMNGTCNDGSNPAYGNCDNNGTTGYNSGCGISSGGGGGGGGGGCTGGNACQGGGGGGGGSGGCDCGCGNGVGDGGSCGGRCGGSGGGCGGDGGSRGGYGSSDGGECRCNFSGQPMICVPLVCGNNGCRLAAKMPIDLEVDMDELVASTKQHTENEPPPDNPAALKESDNGFTGQPKDKK